MKGFTEEEVQMYKKQVHRNIFENIRLLITSAEKLQIALSDPVCKRCQRRATLLLS
jgi:thymidine kinase